MLKIDKFRQKVSSFCNSDKVVSKIIEKIGKFDRTLTITITSTDSEVQRYVVFGPNIFGYTDSAGNGRNVTTSISETPYDQVKRSMTVNPFITLQAKFRTNNNDNLSRSISYAVRTDTGFTNTKLIDPINYLEPENKYESGQSVIRITDFNNLLFDGDHALIGRIEPNSTITIVLTIKEMVILTNILMNKEVVLKDDLPDPGPAPIQVQFMDPINL